jgi:hypothetical protein
MDANLIPFEYKRGLSLQERIERNSMPVPECNCWVWLLHVSKKTGHGKICINKSSVLAHRAAWIAFNGAIENGLCVLHRCGVPCCVNPDHLFLGTQIDNLADMDRKGRRRVKGRAPLDFKQKIEIAGANGLHKNIARKYGICRSRVGQIKRAIKEAEAG